MKSWKELFEALEKGIYQKTTSYSQVKTTPITQVEQKVMASINMTAKKLFEFILNNDETHFTEIKFNEFLSELKTAKTTAKEKKGFIFPDEVEPDFCKTQLAYLIADFTTYRDDLKKRLADETERKLGALELAQKELKEIKSQKEQAQNLLINTTNWTPENRIHFFKILLGDQHQEFLQKMLFDFSPQSLVPSTANAFYANNNSQLTTFQSTPALLPEKYTEFQKFYPKEEFNKDKSKKENWLKEKPENKMIYAKQLIFTSVPQITFAAIVDLEELHQAQTTTESDKKSIEVIITQLIQKTLVSDNLPSWKQQIAEIEKDVTIPDSLTSKWDEIKNFNYKNILPDSTLSNRQIMIKNAINKYGFPHAFAEELKLPSTPSAKLS